MSNQLYLSVTLLLITAKLYIDHRNKNYSGPYNNDQSYDSIKPMKHDLLKQTTLDLVPLLVYGLSAGDVLYNVESVEQFLDSVVGRIAIGLASYVVYYQVVEPYIGSRLPSF